MSGDLEACNVFLKDLTDEEVNRVASRSGDTPLHVCARLGRTGAARMLLERRADVESRNNEGERPLHVAARAGCSSMLGLLLTARANVLAPGPERRSALFVCLDDALPAAAEVCGVLLGARATAAHPKTGLSALHAAHHHHRQLCRILNEHPPPQMSKMEFPARKVPYDALLWAVQKGQVATARALIAAGASADPMDQAKTPLHVACAASQAEMVQVLLRDYGVRPNAIDSDGNTALHYAGRNGCSPGVGMVIQSLLAHDADVVVRNDVGELPFQCAEAVGAPDNICQLLVTSTDQLPEAEVKASRLHLRIADGDEV